jgi:hypothetical protein
MLEGFLPLRYHSVLVTFNVISFYSRGYHSVLEIFQVDIHLPLRVFFHRNLEVHSCHIPTFWQHLPTIRVQYAIFLKLRLNNVISHRCVSLDFTIPHNKGEQYE